MNEIETERLKALIVWCRDNGVASLRLPDGTEFALHASPDTYGVHTPGQDESVVRRDETPEQRAERELREYEDVLFHSAG